MIALNETRLLELVTLAADYNAHINDLIRRRIEPPENELGLIDFVLRVVGIRPEEDDEWWDRLWQVAENYSEQEARRFVRDLIHYATTNPPRCAA